MSLETELHKLTEAMLTLASAIVGSPGTLAPADPTPAEVPNPAPAPVAPAAPIAPAPVALAPAPAPAMPPAPNLETPAPVAPVTGVVPFTDPKGLVDWVMAKYKELGPTNGALIQNVLVGLGYQNINEVKPEHYPNLVMGVEAIPTS